MSQIGLQKRRQVIRLPRSLSLQYAVQFAKELWSASGYNSYHFECAALEHCPPFGLLYTSSTIRTFRDAHPGSTFTASGLINDYAAHMGFWKSCGIPFGKSPNEARGNDRYTPINTITREQISNPARGIPLAMIDEMDDQAGDIASILTQDYDSVFHTTIQYSIRELFRNTIDHSESDTIWYCAQYWPTKDLVELAVLDNGIGIQSSLEKNPEIAFANEIQSIMRATERGVTSINLIATPVPGMWPGYGESENLNAGWGLYVLRRIAEEVDGGSLVVVSGNSCVKFELNRTTSFDAIHIGTGVRILLNPSKLGDTLLRILAATLDDSGRLPSKLTPSMMARVNNRL